MQIKSQHQGLVFLMLLALFLSSCTPKPTVTANSKPIIVTNSSHKIW